MAVLSEADRVECWREFMRRAAGPLSVTKAQVRAMIDALDTFMNDNAAAANTAIPQPARGDVSTSDKALALTIIIAKRYMVGS